MSSNSHASFHLAASHTLLVLQSGYAVITTTTSSSITAAILNTPCDHAILHQSRSVEIMPPLPHQYCYRQHAAQLERRVLQNARSSPRFVRSQARIALSCSASQNHSHSFLSVSLSLTPSYWLLLLALQSS
eukprot:1392983-Pleurochrysis_carterae.AAC.1